MTIEKYSRPEHMRVARAAEARGLKLLKSRARILGNTNKGQFQLQGRDGRAIAGALFDATLQEIAPLIFGEPVVSKTGNSGRAA